jgi:hypothetical protein
LTRTIATKLLRFPKSPLCTSNVAILHNCRAPGLSNGHQYIKIRASHLCNLDLYLVHNRTPIVPKVDMYTSFLSHASSSCSTLCLHVKSTASSRGTSKHIVGRLELFLYRTENIPEGFSANYTTCCTDVEEKLDA